MIHGRARTHEEQYRQMLKEAGIAAVVHPPNNRMTDGRNDVTVSLRESRPEVRGYERYYVRHVFNLDGSLHRIEVFY